jgi:hypothetical protein
VISSDSLIFIAPVMVPMFQHCQAAVKPLLCLLFSFESQA